MVKIVTFIMINLLLISFLEHHIECSEIQHVCVCVCVPGEKTISYHLTHIFVKERYVGKRISFGFQTVLC